MPVSVSCHGSFNTPGTWGRFYDWKQDGLRCINVTERVSQQIQARRFPRGEAGVATPVT